MRPLHFLVLLLALPSSAAVTIEQTTYNAWPNDWRISNDSCELVIVPQITRVMRFALKDGKNIFWEDPKLAGKTFPTDDGVWHNIGGEKLWPTQQKELFKKYTGKDGWPPPILGTPGRATPSASTMACASRSPTIPGSAPTPSASSSWILTSRASTCANGSRRRRATRRR